MKYIDAEKLIALLEQRKKQLAQWTGKEYANQRIDEIDCILDVDIDSLQQEPDKNLEGAAEKDHELTIKDLELLHTFLYAMKNNKQGVFTFTRLSDEQYNEVLRRFKEERK